MSSAKICPYLAFFQSQLFFAFLFGTGLVCTRHFFSSHQNQNTCPSNGCFTHFLTFLFIHAKQFFFVMFQVKNWLHATPKDVTEPRSSLATTVSRFIRGPFCTFWAVQELNQECQLLWTCMHCCFLLFEAVAAAPCWL